MTDLIKIIKNDHKIVEELFKQYEASGEGALKTKQALAGDICDFLKIHADMEEKIMYPKQEAKFNKEGDKLMEEAYAEHEIVKVLIAGIESMQAGDPQFDAKLKVLHENISHHIKEEEDKVLPKTIKEFSEEELAEMAHEMELFKLDHL